ncbi:MAG TPA: helix-turn-helix transcriptional regulator [Steroidobacteraceae bacterium]
MKSPIQPFIGMLKSARERKGLSQRALGDRVGLPQSHISKIENGTVDLQTSSLIEIARALDLELALIPRSALPAVLALQDNQSQQQQTGRPTSEVDGRLHSLINRASRMTSRYPHAKVLKRLVRTATEARLVPPLISEGELRQLTETLNDLLAQLRRLDNARRATQPAEPLIRDIEFSEERLRRLRNSVVHRVPDRQSDPQPAYSLDDSGDNDG